jgi:3-hydroxyacyl-[acyl-carrier-protein] dehydratase
LEQPDVPPRDYIINPNEYDLSTIIADIEEIRRYNQQRFEMEQLTAIVHEDKERGRCVGYKDTKSDEFWARGHFPNVPLMPGVIMCEAAAQLSSYFSQKHQLLEAEMIGFGGLEDVRFREPVRPGDRLVVAVERVRVRPKAMIVCRFQGLVGDSVVVDGVIKGVPLPVDFLTASQTTSTP